MDISILTGQSKKAREHMMLTGLALTYFYQYRSAIPLNG